MKFTLENIGSWLKQLSLRTWRNGEFPETEEDILIFKTGRKMTQKISGNSLLRKMLGEWKKKKEREEHRYFKQLEDKQ